MSSGLFGGSGGDEWSYKPKGRISKITLFYEQAIYGIRFCSVYAGKSIWSPTFGSIAPKGYATTICIKYLEEKFTIIGGTSRNLSKGGLMVVTSLTFITNLKMYGPFGDAAGRRFDIPILDGQIIAKFIGRSGIYLFAIGINVIPCPEEGEIIISDDDSFASAKSTMKKQRQREVSKTPTKSKESMQKLRQLFEDKINEIYDNAQDLTIDCPISSFKAEIRATVRTGSEMLSCEKVTALEPLYLELVEKEGCFCEDDRLVMVKFRVVMEFMKEVKRLEELRNMLKEREVEYRQEYARTDEYFTFMKKSVDMTTFEDKNDAKQFQYDGLPDSDLSIPLKFFNSIMPEFIINLEKKAEEFKELEEEVGEMEMKKKFAFDLLLSIS